MKQNTTLTLTVTLLLALLWFRGSDSVSELPQAEHHGSHELPLTSTADGLTPPEEIDSISWAEELGEAPFLPANQAFERAQANYLESLGLVGKVDLPLQHIDESLSVSEVERYEEQRILTRRREMIQELNEEPLELTDLDKQMASYMLREAGFTSVYDYEE